MIPPAQKTGRLTLVTNAMAREILVGKDGRAEGVSYIDKKTRSETRIRAKAVMVSATRVRVGAPPAEFEVVPVPPTVWRIPSGVVGRNLMDSTGSEGVGYFPADGKGSRRTTMTGLAGCTCTFRGGKFDRKNDFPAWLPHRNLGWTFYAGRWPCSMTPCDEVEGLRRRA